MTEVTRYETLPLRLATQSAAIMLATRRLFAPHVIATAMGQHNYSGLSPFTGDVGWVFCHPDHRGHALGLALCARVTQRFLDAGYTKIQLHTEHYRLPAIKTYLKLGYVPVITSPQNADLWAEVCEQLDWPYKLDNWKMHTNNKNR